MNNLKAYMAIAIKHHCLAVSMKGAEGDAWRKSYDVAMENYDKAYKLCTNDSTRMTVSSKKKQLVDVFTASATVPVDKMPPVVGASAETVQVVIEDVPDITFADIIGHEDVKQTLRNNFIAPTRFPALYGRDSGRDVSTGLLLYGPPGTGKTDLARALAGEAKTRYIYVDPKTIDHEHFGVSTRKVAAIFETASKNAPIVIFIDEMDCLCKMRDEGSISEARLGIVTQLQLSMNIVKEVPGVFLLGATNRPWAVETAMLRRLNDQVYVGLPTAEDVAEMIWRRLQKRKHVITRDEINAFAANLRGYSGSDVKNLLTEALNAPIAAIYKAEYFCGNDTVGYYPCTSDHVPDNTEFVVVNKKLDALPNNSILDLPTTLDDLHKAAQKIKPSVTEKALAPFCQYQRERSNQGGGVDISMTNESQ